MRLPKGDKPRRESPWARTWARGALLLLSLAPLGGCGASSESRRDDARISRVTIKGLLSVPDSGRFQIVDCHSSAPFTLGGMSAGNLHYLKRRFGELSRRAPGPVTAEVSGHIRRSSKGFQLDRPALIYVASGRCVEADDHSLDYN